MEDLGDNETAIKALQRSFMDTHHKTVTGHNHLLTLYKIVSFLSALGYLD